MKKILIITDSIDIEDSSGSKANVAIIKNLVATGFEVLVYHYTRKDIQIQGANCVSIPEIRWSLLFFISRLQRYFTLYTKLNINNFIEGKLGFSLVYLNDSASIVKSLKKCDFDAYLIITLSKGGSFRPHHAVLKIPKYHAKWLAYIHDPYPMHCYPRPYNWVETSYRQKENFVRLVSEKARWSGFPSLLLKDWMSTYFLKFGETGVVIPHQNADNGNHDKTLPDYFDPQNFNVLHAGNLMSTRPPNGLIEGFLKFLKNNPDAAKDSVLLHVGAAYQKSYLQQFIQHPNIVIKQQAEAFGTVFSMQKCTSVNVILESKAEISPFLPAKFAHCVAANKPILALGPYYSETRRLLGDEYQFWCEVDDAEIIAKHIEKLFLVWKSNPINLKLNRADLEEYLSSKRLFAIINDLDNR